MSRARWRTWTPFVVTVCVATAGFAACSSDTKKHVMAPDFGDSGAGGDASPGSGDAGGPSTGGNSGTSGAGGNSGAAGNPGGLGEGGFGGTFTGIGAGGQPYNTGDAGAAGTPPTSHDHPYATITALYDAIDAAQLGNGDTWTVSWAADARVTSAGSITGNITAGAPNPSVLDQGALPLKLFAPKDWATIGPLADFSFDTDGYPKMQSVNTGTAAVGLSIKLSHARYAFGRFTSMRMRIAQDLTGAADLTGIGMIAIDDSNQDTLIGNHFVEAGGGTMSVAMDYYAAGVPYLSGGFGSSSTRAFDGIWTFTPNFPYTSTLEMTHQLFNLTNVALGSRTAAITGHGDWSANTGLQYSAGMQAYIAPNGTGSSSAVGVTFEVKRYTP